MYLDHFGLDETPFSITPDPRFLYLSERYREALAHLLYGAGEAGGFLQLTGEVGTGKTMICRAFLAQLPGVVDVALVLNPKLTASELLCNVLDELQIPLPHERDSTRALIDRLNAHLLQAHGRGRRTLLLIDEAQNLSPDVLEQIRLLTNLETDRHKLLQIFLIGQPELRELLEQPGLRQVAQRITARCHLAPMTREETRAYVEHRLHVAGARASLFSRGALNEVHLLSGGVPRLVNSICDRALLGSYAAGRDRAGRKIVRRAAAELRGYPIRHRPSFTRAILLGCLALAVGSVGFTPEARSTLTLAFESIAPLPTMDITAKNANRAAMDNTAREKVTTASAFEPPPPPDPAPLPAHIRIQQLIWTLSESRDSSAVEAALLARWGVNVNGPVGHFCRTAGSHGLRCLLGTGGWAELRRLDRPAILRFWEGDRSHHALLTSLDREHVEFRLPDNTRRSLPLTEGDEFWRGEYLILWRPPEPDASLIGSRSSSWAVRWLWERLDGGRPVPESYTGAVRDKVTRFQRQHDLEEDGVAGPRTLIQLNSITGDPTIPRLDAREET